MSVQPSRRGLFVTLEGGEGAGKSSVIVRLQGMLVAEGHEVVVTREPGSTWLGETIRDWLLAPKSQGAIGAEAELLLFLAARAQHLEEVIRPALAANKVVLCDRFNDSTIAYQGYGRGLDIPKVAELCLLACAGTLPDVTLFLDVDPTVGLRRATAHRAQDRLESEALSFHQRVRKGFRALAEQHPNRIHSIDASQSLNDVVKQAFQEIKWH